MNLFHIPEEELVDPRQFIIDGVMFQEVTLAQLYFFAEKHPQFLTKLPGEEDVWVAPVATIRES